MMSFSRPESAGGRTPRQMECDLSVEGRGYKGLATDLTPNALCVQLAGSSLPEPGCDVVLHLRDGGDGPGIQLDAVVERAQPVDTNEPDRAGALELRITEAPAEYHGLFVDDDAPDDRTEPLIEDDPRLPLWREHDEAPVQAPVAQPAEPESTSEQSDGGATDAVTVHDQDVVQHELAERRSGPRAPGGVSVRLQAGTWNWPHQSTLLDLSSSGCRVATRQNLPSLSIVKLSLRPSASGGRRVSLEGRIIRRQQGEATGEWTLAIRFVNVSAVQRGGLDGLLGQTPADPTTPIGDRSDRNAQSDAETTPGFDIDSTDDVDQCEGESERGVQPRLSQPVVGQVGTQQLEAGSASLTTVSEPRPVAPTSKPDSPRAHSDGTLRRWRRARRHGRCS